MLFTIKVQKHLKNNTEMKENYRLKYLLKRELFLIDGGMGFHKTGEVTEKERSPKVLSRVLGTASKFLSAERRLL